MALISHLQSNLSTEVCDLDEVIRRFCHLASGLAQKQICPQSGKMEFNPKTCAFVHLLSCQAMNLELRGPVKEDLAKNEANTEKYSDVWAFAFGH